MKRSFYLGILFLLVVTIATPCQSQDRIEFDGYWWGTATTEQKIGFIQGFMSGSGTMTYIFVASMVKTFSKYAALRKDMKNFYTIFSSWNPYDRSFGFYLERIDAFYKTTQDMKTPVAKIMLDLMNPMPN